MKPIPSDILAQFDAVLNKRAVPVNSHADYRKWLLYYLDFRSKYSLPDSMSEHVRLFIEKLKKKNQSPEQQKQVAHALSLFFESQNDKRKAEATTPATLGDHNSPYPPLILRGGGEAGGVTDKGESLTSSQDRVSAEGLPVNATNTVRGRPSRLMPTGAATFRAI